MEDDEIGDDDAERLTKLLKNCKKTMKQRRNRHNEEVSTFKLRNLQRKDSNSKNSVLFHNLFFSL